MIFSLNSQKNQTASISTESFASEYSVIEKLVIKGPSVQQERESVIVPESL